MKTAEEWLVKLTGNSPAVGGDFVLTPEEIKQIQLDAWKQGMKDALKQEPNEIPMHGLHAVNKYSDNIRKAIEEKKEV